ncbi:endo-1,4-beta-xylanase [Paenibacillus sp. FSL R7-0333]|uniref:endo-1,4-beta-xylanase n=1 Tax=Paenibacillus sp. FSL R7-0333 TaxID=1926587 RepID=UPI00096CAE8F|nr:thermostable celloxylanase [Paenibacillus sp. FSL R7-0333]
MRQNNRTSTPARLARSIVFAAALLWLSGCSAPGGDAAPAASPPGNVASSPAASPAGTPAAALAASPEAAAEAPVQQEAPPLAAAYADYFPIGAAVEPDQLEGPAAELLKRHVNWLVAENAMKPDAIAPAEGTFTWERADRIVAFAKANGMGLRFHTLVWHSQTPEWFFQDEAGQAMADETDAARREANKKLLLKRLDSYITAVVSRYKDDISSWDVVNEVIEPGDPDGMRASDWYKITGTEFIETAFRAARKAGGPELKLYINDYGTDNPEKRDRLYELVKDMLAKGVPIDGVGHQTHINLDYPSVESIIESMEKFHALGLDNQITELDMSLYVYNDLSDVGPVVPEDILQRQAARYGELFAALRDRKELLSGVMFWGIADDHTWLSTFPAERTEAPMLFDRQHQPKPAFQAVTDF